MAIFVGEPPDLGYSGVGCISRQFGQAIRYNLEVAPSRMIVRRRSKCREVAMTF
jgi:hypothetical protein